MQTEMQTDNRQAEITESIAQIGAPPDGATAHELATYAALQAQEARVAAVRTQLDLRWAVADIKQLLDRRLGSIEQKIEKTDRKADNALLGVGKFVGKQTVFGAAFGVIVMLARYFFGF